MPDSLKRLAKRIYLRGGNWAHPSLKGFGTVQDLYYWVVDDDIDTLLLLQNYFSAFYPEIDTATVGKITLRDHAGIVLGGKTFAIPHQGGIKIKVSSVLEELNRSVSDRYGTLEVHIEIPDAVLHRIQNLESLYFWDRFYIGYTTSRGQTFFVHGVDKTNIYQEGSPDPIGWYKKANNHEWAPEIPVDIMDYDEFTVILLNRTDQTTHMTLVLTDRADNFLSWGRNVPSKGVSRVALNQENTSALERTELRMRLKGMATEFGRPILFKRFPNGAMSAMHC